MQAPQRQMICLAERIHGRLQALHRTRYSEVVHQANQFADDLLHVRRISDLLDVCMSRNWRAAAEHTADRLVQLLRDLPYHVGEIERAAESSKVRPPHMREILADLQQAQEEFEKFRYSKDENLLVVTTEPIELEGCYLGEFEIQLRVGSLAEMPRHTSVYRIVALDPHPAACDESITHPHVSNERLCEGHASAAIQAALANGRICDFFQLVHAVLTTYNPESPYVSLADWEGRPCYDCGCTMNPDSTSCCSSCENDFCEDCIAYCRRCDESTCRGCLEECSVCGDLVCSSCKTNCPNCSKLICKNCLEEEQCPCIQERQEQQENEDEREHDESGRTTSDSNSTGNAIEQAGPEAA